MKGKRVLTVDEAKRIRSILGESGRTKATRERLRAIGFYISDFALKPMFRVADYDRLLAAGEITITASGGTSVGASRGSAGWTATLEGARNRYRPERICHLMVGESAPYGGTFFYHANSRLFRQTHKAFQLVFGEACGNGEEFLQYFCNRSFFLDDLCAVPVDKMDDAERLEHRAAAVPGFSERLCAMRPEAVIVVMKAVAPQVRQACDLAGIDSPCLELPFPRPEHQADFVSGLAGYLRRMEGSK